MGWQWHQLDNMQIICSSLQTDNHASTSWLNFLQAGCSSWRRTNILKPKLDTSKLSATSYIRATKDDQGQSGCGQWTQTFSLWILACSPFCRWAEVLYKDLWKCTVETATLQSMSRIWWWQWQINLLLLQKSMPSVLWHCWFGIVKSIWPVKNWVMRCWHGYLSAVRYKWFAHGSADATAALPYLASLKSRLV